MTVPSLTTAIHEYIEDNGLWGREITVKRGDHVHHYGGTDRNIYYVQSGLIQSYVDLNGQEQTIRFAYQGDFLIVLDTFLSGRPSELSGQALRKTVLRLVDSDRFLDATRRDPVARGLWTDVTTWLLLGQFEREIDLLTNDPEERYRRVARRSPRLFQEVPAKYVANYLRMTPETLSRIRSRRKR